MGLVPLIPSIPQQRCDLGDVFPLILLSAKLVFVIVLPPVDVVPVVRHGRHLHERAQLHEQGGIDVLPSAVCADQGSTYRSERIFKLYHAFHRNRIVVRKGVLALCRFLSRGPTHEVEQPHRCE